LKVKVFRSVACLLALFSGSLALAAEKSAGESRFDALAKSVAPIVGLLTPAGSNGNHAIDLQTSALEVSGLPEEFKGARIRVAFQFPDKLRVELPIGGTTAVICRNGQSVWAYPSSLFGPIVDRVGATVSTAPLPPFQIDPTKAALLPALLDVHDSGVVKLGDESYRVLDFRPACDTKNKGGGGAWPARIWVKPSDHRIAQLGLRFSGWSATLSVEKLDLAPSLPSDVWMATPDQQPHVIAVPGEKIGTLLELALKEGKAARPPSP
jgi:outer membrane lipoprotein-sorting protein